MNKITATATTILVLWVLVSMAAMFMPIEPNKIDLARVFAPPSLEEVMGHDELGRSVLARVVSGTKISFGIGFTVVGLAGFLGTAIGLYSGWKGGVVDLILVRVLDIFLAFPGILLAVALAGILGPGIGNVVIALAAVGWVGFARLARVQTLSLKQRDHVIISGALGTPPLIILLRHIVPLLMQPLIVEITFGIAGVIVAEAGLSFLGLGIQPPTASWGSMIKEGTRYMLVAPHLVIMPGLALMSVVIALNLLGDYIRDNLYGGDRIVS